MRRVFQSELEDGDLRGDQIFFSLYALRPAEVSEALGHVSNVPTHRLAQS